MNKHISRHGGRLFLLMLSGPLLLASGYAAAVDCDREAIAFYLKSGFSHEQIVRMCSGVTAPQPAGSEPIQPMSNTPGAVVAPAQAPYPSQQTAPRSQMQGGVPLDDVIYFKSVVDADKVEITPEQLIYTDEGCIKYGEEDPNGFKEEACVLTRTTIQFAGLQVIKAVSGIPLVIDKELLVGGNIRRELLNTSRVSERKLKEFKKEYSLAPKRVDIPTHSGVRPEEVALKLRTMASR